MTPIEPKLLEQLCAWMDGELPADEARFLQRRLDGDAALRAQWERWQLARACLRGEAVRVMPPSVSDAISAAVAAAPARAARWPWLAGAAAAVLVAFLLPRLVSEGSLGPPASADATLASSTSAPQFGTQDPAAAAPVTPVAPAASVRDFPLAETAGRKPWPRSPLVPDERTMEAYLVRHNALMAEDGLGGFLPYVDVVANGDDPAPVDAGRPPR